MRALLGFPWPTPPGECRPPRWNGRAFEMTGGPVRVLTFQTGNSHWSNDLTALHETEAGRHHPIDRASRRLAVASMSKASEPVEPVLLDAGCSSGYLLEDLHTALPNAGLIGADFIRGPLEGVARRMTDIPLLQFDLRACPLATACIDGVTCLNVLEHIDDHQAALAEIHRILKPGGIAHIEVPAHASLYDIYDEHLMHHRRYELAELVAMARAVGFAVEKATHLGFLVFPGFWWIKRRNRRKLSAAATEKARVVAQQIRSTRSNPLLGVVIRLETELGRMCSFPCGIRCIIVARKL